MPTNNSCSDVFAAIATEHYGRSTMLSRFQRSSMSNASFNYPRTEMLSRIN